MKRCIYCLAFFLFLNGYCLSNELTIRYKTDKVWDAATLEQSLQLWVEAEALWCLQAKAANELRFLDLKGEFVTEGALISGTGSGQNFSNLLVDFDVVALGVGQHSLQLEFKLEGAQGILGLSLRGDNWILPLSSYSFQMLKMDGEIIHLLPNQWYLVQSDERIFYNDQEVNLFDSIIVAASCEQTGNEADLWWTKDFTCLETGEWGQVELNLNGICPGGTLLIYANANLHLGNTWYLDSQKINCGFDQEGNLTLQIPQLSSNNHVLRGSVQALLVPNGDNGELTASWHDQKAKLLVPIDRSWFDHKAIQNIRISTSSPLLFPSGDIQQSQGLQKTEIDGMNLNLILPLDDPAYPVWTGLPFSENIIWSPLGVNGSFDSFIPVLIFDQGLHWRLISATESLFLDISEERQLLLVDGSLGVTSLQVSVAEGQAKLVSTWHNSHEKDGWYCWKDEKMHRGIYRREKWLWSFGFPYESDLSPSLGVEYFGKNFGFGLHPEDIRCRFSANNWAWGANLTKHSLWAQFFEPNLRFELKPKELRINYKGDILKEVKFCLNAENMSVDCKGNLGEAFFKCGKGGNSLGLRFKHNYTQDKRLLGAQGAIQIKEEIVLLEVGAKLGYSLNSWCTLFAEGELSASILWREQTNKVNLNYGGGLILQPTPAVVGVVGWDNQQDLYFKAGVVLPFTSRN